MALDLCWFLRHTWYSHNTCTFSWFPCFLPLLQKKALLLIGAACLVTACSAHTYVRVCGLGTGERSLWSRTLDRRVGRAPRTAVCWTILGKKKRDVSPNHVYRTLLAKKAYEYLSRTCTYSVAYFWLRTCISLMCTYSSSILLAKNACYYCVEVANFSPKLFSEWRGSP